MTAHTGGLEHREALIYTLGKAAELEHLVMLQYLFAAFSLKQSVDEGLTPETLAAVQRWRRTLLEISAQEMLHLALVQNLLTAVGAAPRFARPNFPMPRLRLPGRRPDRAAAVRRGRPPPLRLPRAAGGDGRRRRRGVRGDRPGRRAAPRRRTTRSSRSSRSSTRSASSTDPSRPAWHTSTSDSARTRLFIGPPRRPGDRGALPLAGARRRDRPRVRAARHRHHRRAGRGCPRRVARCPLRAAPGHPRRLPGAQGRRIRASSPPGRSWQPTSGRSPPASSCP